MCAYLKIMVYIKADVRENVQLEFFHRLDYCHIVNGAHLEHLLYIKIIFFYIMTDLILNNFRM